MQIWFAPGRIYQDTRGIEFAGTILMQVQPDQVSLDTLQQQLNAVLPDENSSLGIPPECYADAGLLALEQRAVFLY